MSIRVAGSRKMIELKSIESYYWGLEFYSQTLLLQEQAWKKVCLEDHPGFILAGEVRPTITQGIRAQSSDIFNPQILAEKKDWKIFQVKRGGETTLHSPGQLVIYPIFNLKKLKLGVREYVSLLLRVSVETFRHFGVEVQSQLNPVGLFTNTGKIGFCGLQIKNGVSQHGLSLNIQNDLTLFNSIISCGMKSASYDKLQNNSKVQISPHNFFNHWAEKACLEGNLQKNQTLATNWSSRDSAFLKSFALEF